MIQVICTVHRSKRVWRALLLCLCGSVGGGGGEAATLQHALNGMPGEERRGEMLDEAGWELEILGDEKCACGR